MKDPSTQEGNDDEDARSSVTTVTSPASSPGTEDDARSSQDSDITHFYTTYQQFWHKYLQSRLVENQSQLSSLQSLRNASNTSTLPINSSSTSNTLPLDSSCNPSSVENIDFLTFLRNYQLHQQFFQYQLQNAQQPQSPFLGCNNESSSPIRRLRRGNLERKPRQAYSAKQLERLEAEFQVVEMSN